MAISHLKTRKQFQQLLAQTPVARTTHFCMHRLPVHLLDGGSGLLHNDSATLPTEPAAQLVVGALIPKRWAKRAVTRNLVRRHVYALALEHQREIAKHGADVPAQAILIRLRSSLHAKASTSKRTGSKKKGASASTPSAQTHATPVFRSASSKPLGNFIRQQLMQLLERGLPAEALTTPPPSHSHQGAL